MLNNLTNISFLPEYATICGITEQEVTEYFTEDISLLAEANGWTEQETHKRLKEYYDGYHFCDKSMTDIYNPFSFINALKHKRISNYWAASGATILLSKFISDMEIKLDNFDNCSILRNTLETSDVTDGGAELFLFQSGYLTIKHADEFGYILGFPNEEVRQALYDMVLPTLTMRAESETQSLQASLFRQLGTGQLNEAKNTLKSLIADVPYSNKKLASMDMEERYRLIISSILNAIGFRVEVERMLATGRIDIVAYSYGYIYVMELKLSNNGGMLAAKEQILNNKYLDPFKADKRKVIGLAIELDEKGKGLIDWEEV